MPAMSRIEPLGFRHSSAIAARVDVAEHDASFAFERVERLGVGGVTAVTVRDRESRQHVAALRTDS